MGYTGATGLDKLTDAIDTLTATFASDIKSTSNYISKLDACSSNYVLSTSNILIGRVVSDINDTSNYDVAVAAARATLTAACVVGNGITTLSLIQILETKVNTNKTEADKIGGWSSNYGDKIAVWSSNYTDIQSRHTSNYADKLVVWSSNYTDIQSRHTSNYADKIAVWSSNYTDIQSIKTYEKLR